APEPWWRQAQRNDRLSVGTCFAVLESRLATNQQRRSPRAANNFRATGSIANKCLKSLRSFGSPTRRSASFLSNWRRGLNAICASHASQALSAREPYADVHVRQLLFLPVLERPPRGLTRLLLSSPWQALVNRPPVAFARLGLVDQTGGQHPICAR